MTRPALVVDAHAPGPAGLGRYTRQMVTALAAREDFRAIYLAGDPAEMQEWIGGMPLAATPVHVISFIHRRHSPLVPLRWAQVVAQVAEPMRTWLPHFDGAWSPRPDVTTLHDVIHLSDRSAYGRLRAMIVERWMRRMVGASRRLLTGSAAAAEGIAARFPGATSKLQVVHHGVAEIFHAAGRGELDIEQIREPGAPTNGIRYLLTVASKRPHKRLETAIRAFARLAREDQALRLVMVGPRHEHAAALRSLAHSLGVADRVDDLADLSDHALAQTYRNAVALLVPSREEGFGLVIIEAMAAGTPVIVVDAPPLPEVAGGAAAIVPLDDDAAMAAAIRTLDRGALRARGLERARAFTWAKAAEQTAKLLVGARDE